MQNNQTNNGNYIKSHGYEIYFNPLFGGRIDAIKFNGLPILRETLQYTSSDPLQSACFPLVPFSNRIRAGVFIFNGKEYQLTPNWDGDQPVIHGEAWQKPWNVLEHSENHVIMQFEGQGWWPWEYRAVQSISISNQGIDIKLEIENLSDSEMPAGLGFHPYFPKYKDTKLQFNSDAIWPPMTDKPLKTNNIPHLYFNQNRQVADYPLDHCFENLRGDIIIEQPSLGLNIAMQCISGDSESSESRHVIVYNPTDDYFCVEPVSHITGAIGKGEIEKPINILESNEKISLHIRIHAQMTS